MPADEPASRRPRCGVLGSPVSHSLSPVLHRAAYLAMGLDWAYDAHEVDEAGLPAFLSAMGDDWRGLSLTMPLKQAVLAHCANLSDEARLVSSVNTVVVDADRSLAGHNTDVPGFVAAWHEAGISGVDQAVVLGAGATGRSAVAALAAFGVTRVTVLVRALGRAALLRSLLRKLEVDSEVRLLSDAPRLTAGGLVVSTVPVSAGPALLAEASIADLIGRAAALFDVAYGQRDSPLVVAGRRAGVPCTDGMPLLLHQAALQVELMTGRQPAPLEQMRAAGFAELTRRGQSPP